MDELIRELKEWGVLQSHYVETAFRAIDRKDFVPLESADEAYANYPLPIGRGQTISQPYTVAFMLDLLDPRPGERILDVGAGSGWQTTILAEIVSQKGSSGKVYAIERVPELCGFAKKNIERYGFLERGVVELTCGDATGGLPAAAPFDKIIAAAEARDEIPPAWRDQLKIGGCIVAPIANSIWRYTKKTETTWHKEEFSGFVFVPLIKNGSEKTAGDQRAEEGRPYGSPRRRTRRFILTAALLTLAFLGYATFAPLRLAAGSAHVEIPAGIGSRAIGYLLKDRGLIRSKWLFVGYATLAGAAGDLKPGAYEFHGAVSIPQIVTDLTRGGRESNERLITIPEGWDLRDIGRYLEKEEVLRHADLYAITGEPVRSYRSTSAFPPAGSLRGVFPSLAAKPASVSLEGYLYPDTYRVYRDTSASDIVAKMLGNFEEKLSPDLRVEIRRQGKSVFALVTMASLIEKEVAGEDDRRIVAGILWERLRRGIPLQVDASINYITAKRGTPSLADLAIDSPYNTYRRAGLPAGPIANPGIGAIRAALSPRSSGYLYYLSAPDGTTVFSRTLEEHQRARSRYLGK